MNVSGTEQSQSINHVDTVAVSAMRSATNAEQFSAVWLSSSLEIIYVYDSFALSFDSGRCRPATVNPLKCTGVRQLHLKVYSSMPSRSNLHF